jgi:subtilase family serine protease
MTIRPAAAFAPQPKGPRPPGPDLVVTDIEPSTYFPHPGEAVTFQVEVQNQGDADAPAFNVRLEASRNGQDERRLEGLAAGSRTRVGMGPIFIDAWSGHTWVEALADSSREVPESNEGNNWASIVLWGPEPPRPPEPPIPRPPIP